MIRLVLRILGILLAILAFVEAYFAMWFRLESADELRMIEQVDLALGTAFAIAFVLMFAPYRFEASRAWSPTLLIAVMIWVGVSVSLIWSHREQHRIRSAPLSLVSQPIRPVVFQCPSSNSPSPKSNTTWA